MYAGDLVTAKVSSGSFLAIRETERDVDAVQYNSLIFFLLVYCRDSRF